MGTGSPSTDEPTSVRRSNGRVLLVDDRPENLASLEAILEPLDLDLVRAASCAEGLAALVDDAFALVLLDTHEGMESAAAIRERAGVDRTPVIFLAADGSPAEGRRAYELGAADFLVGPFDPIALRAKVAVFLALDERLGSAHRDAEAARADLHLLFMQAPAPICVLRGSEHVLELANPEFMRLVGTARSVVGLPYRRALPELASQGFFELLDRVYATGERFTGSEVTAKLARGEHGEIEEAIFDFVYEPFRDLDGRVAGILIIAFDVTASVHARLATQASLADRSRLLRVAEEARRDAEAANRAKDEFLATASHELRTPLNAILGWARMLRSGKLDASARMRGVETIERNANAQVQLVEDILDGARILNGKLHLEIRALDLVAVVRAAIDGVRPVAEAKNVALTLTFDADASHVTGDPDRLQQVVWNLVNNAIKFTPPGGGVDVRLACVDAGVALFVKDTGEGIGSDFLPHVFDHFRQADGTTTRRHGGLGLGLALVRHLVEAHGGAVRAESAGQGRGATFAVTLPMNAVYAGDAPSSRSMRAGERSQSAPPPMSLDGVAVLVVDDQADARDLVATVLRSHGADVTTAASVEDALELLDEHRPMVLVSDIGMPNAKGQALLRGVRALVTKAGKIPAIALTAYAREEDRRRAIAAGFQKHLAKPVEPDALVRMVGDLARTAAPRANA